MPDPDDRYPREAQRAARQYLRARRAAAVSIPVAIALVGVSASATSPALGLPTWGLAVLALTQVGAELGKMTTTARWITSLRHMLDYSPVPQDVRFARWAKATLAGTRVPSELETALTAILEGSDDLDQARRVLARRSVPDVSSEDYEQTLAGVSAWQRHGMRWQDAPLPDIEHTCTGWSVALVHGGTEKAEVVQYCACGAINHPTSLDLWAHRNQRRHEEPAQP